MQQVGPLTGLTVLLTVILSLTIIRQVKLTSHGLTTTNRVLQNISLAAIAIFGFLLAAIFAHEEMPYLALAIVMVDLPTYIIATFRMELKDGVHTRHVVNETDDNK